MVSSIWIVIAAVGFVMAMQRRGGWNFFYVGLVTAVGIWQFFLIFIPQTSFYEDALEQRVFPGFVRRLRYSDIQKVRRGGGRGVSMFIVSSDGKQVKVYGAEGQLVTAQEALAERIPHAFETRPDLDPEDSSDELTE